jgi:predicted MFS family arabinose efflux permease
LTGLRNFLAGITSAIVALAGGEYFLSDTPDIYGYSYTFVLAFVLTMCGLLTLLFMHEPEPPILREKSSVASRLRELPALLRGDPDFARYFTARALTSAGRMAMPFYVLYAGTNMQLSGANLALTTVAFTIASTVSNLVWGAIGDRHGFRIVFILATSLWIAATCALLVFTGIVAMVVVFAGIGAAVQGFQNASMNLTLEFGNREDLPVRIAVANTASEFAGTLGPLAGGFIAASFGYGAVFAVSIAFLLSGGLMVALRVKEPRHSGAAGR